MMQSTFHDDEEDAGFGPNPFRSNAGGVGGMMQPQQQQQQPMSQQDPMMGQFYSPQQPFQQQAFQQQPQQFQQQQYPPPQDFQNTAAYLSGPMDNSYANNNNNAGGNNNSFGGNMGSPTNARGDFGGSGGLLGMCFRCFRLDSYQAFFDVDTVDIQERFVASLTTFWKPDVFRTGILGQVDTVDPNLADAAEDERRQQQMQNKGPDLYGPFWICTTLIFLIAVTSNLSDYRHHLKRMDQVAKQAQANGTDVQLEEFEYDMRHLLRACSVVFFFAMGVPTAFFLGSSLCLSMPWNTISWPLWMCCYGYAQVPILLAVLCVWIVPVELLQWMVLMAAVCASGLLVVRNLSTPLLQQDAASHSRATPLIIGMLAMHFIYFLTLKIAFYE